MPKKVSEEQRRNIVDSFINGLNINDLSKLYGFTVTTINKQLRNELGSEKFKQIKDINHSKNISSNQTSLNLAKQNKKDLTEKIDYQENENNLTNSVNIDNENFFEIVPLTHDIDLDNQKDLSSIPLNEFNFPKIIYMIVDNKIELIVKLLKDYPEWEFLSEVELSRKTIKIFFDLKDAKKHCNKDQKVIKVPNPDVFRLVAPILTSRGITRIVTDEKLIALDN